MLEIGGKTTRIVIMGFIILGVVSIWGACRFIPKRLSICEVQGNDEISPYAGRKVALQGIVSADIEGTIPAGFFLIDQNCPVDEGGSWGIFVEHLGGGDIVHLGDEVLIKGLIEEIGGETRIKSDQVEMEILSVGNDPPQMINIVGEFLINPNTFLYENWEGMLVYFPEGKFLKAFIDSDLPRILPVFDLDPSLQMICLKNQSITLQLSSSEDLMALGTLSNGDLVQNLVGILRQNTLGYMLELIADSDFKVVGRKASLGLLGGSTSVEFTLTETHVPITSGTVSITPTGSPTGTLIPSLTIIPSLTYYPVHLYISEVYPNPTGKEPDGEWVEIYNPETYGQSLTGIKIGDETSPIGKEGMLRFPDGYYIEGKEVLVIARKAKAFHTEFGFLPDFEMEDSDVHIPDLLPYPGWGRSGVQFSNSGDEVLLLDPWDGIVDLLVYGNSTSVGFSQPPPAPKEGHSLERYPPERDRDRGGDWRERELVSPGRLDRTLPTQSASSTHKPSATITPSPPISPSGTSSITPLKPTATVSTGTSTPSEEAIPSPSPSLTVTRIVSPTPGSSPSSTTSPLISPTPSPVLTITIEITQTPSITDSPSLTWIPTTPVSPTAFDTAFPGTITTTTTTSPVVGTGTPLYSVTPSPLVTDTETPVYIEDLEILLNEVLADPDLILGDANFDGQVHSDDDEFLELVNIGNVDLDMSGWSISDSLKIRYVFPVGTILKGGCGLVVFGGGDPQSDFGGSLIFSAGSLGLNNTGDAISLIDESGDEKLYYQYGPEGGDNQSLTRWPDISGVLPLILHSEADGSNGNLYSPGTRLDGSLFGDCP